MKKGFMQLLVFGFIGFSLIGCGPGPMQRQITGPIDTPVFKPVILDTLNDGSKEVLFKERLAAMYIGKDRSSWGNFVITNNGVYLISWNVVSFTYELVYKVEIKNIDKLLDDVVVRSIFPDSNLLVIQDKRGTAVGFSLNNKIAAQNTILSLIEKNK